MYGILSLTPWYRVFPEQLVVTQLFKKFFLVIESCHHESSTFDIILNYFKSSHDILISSSLLHFCPVIAFDKVLQRKFCIYFLLPPHRKNSHKHRIYLYWYWFISCYDLMQNLCRLIRFMVCQYYVKTPSGIHHPLPFQWLWGTNFPGALWLEREAHHRHPTWCRS